MKRFTLLVLVLAAAAAAQDRIVGMYVHQHWPYNHPYAARTWTLDDWKGYAGGLKQLGFNTVLIWPVLETVPEPLTPSDRANLDKIGAVIRMLHRDLKMRAWIVLCPNVAARNEEAAKATFERRHFFWSDYRVNPADPAAMAGMMRWREQLLRPLAEADAVAIIDSDPGGYPGSRNSEFVNLLGEHRKVLDRLRPGIELAYWMHFGWEAYSRYYLTGKAVRGTDDEHLDALSRLAKMNPRPWGVANGLAYARKLGIESRVVEFNYGRIEAEPSFPMTNFSPELAHEAGRGFGAPRGAIGNSQTHCLQLPNTFAFARGATGRPAADADFIAFANDLVPGQGALILKVWKTLAGSDVAAMRAVALELEKAARRKWEPGPLKGLLFGDPRRFARDLVMQLRAKAAYEELRAGIARKGDARKLLGGFVSAVEPWQQQHGYSCVWRPTRWHWAGMNEILAQLHSPAIDTLLNPRYQHPEGFERVKENFFLNETHTVRLIQAMKAHAAEGK